MRRRNLLDDSVGYVFSASTTSVNVNYSVGAFSVAIQSSDANGTNIGFSLVSYDGTVVTSASIAGTYVTIRYSANSTYNQRNGNVVLKQNVSNKTITINVSQSAQPLALGYDGILLDGTSGSYGSISFGSEVSFSDVPSWATVTYSNGNINVTASSTNSSSTARLATVTVSYESSSATLALIQLPSDYHSRSYITIGYINWAIKNVGASSVQDYGNYYQWGAGAVTYKNEDQYYTGNDTLPSSADTATQVMGSEWRMPTRDEIANNLFPFHKYIMSYNGVNGCVFEMSGNVLFFPAGGYYLFGGLYYKGNNGYVWSSTPGDSSNSPYSLVFGKNIYNNVNLNDYSDSFYGMSVRGVQA